MTDDRQSEDMADDLLIRAVAEHWTQIMELANGDQRDRLQGLVDGTAEADPAEALAALEDELLDLLPPDHPVIQVMRTRVMFSGQDADVTETRLAGALRWLNAKVSPEDAGETDPARDDPGDEASDPVTDSASLADDLPAADDFDRQVEARLLGLPSLSADDARLGLASVHEPGLIKLPRPDHSFQVPAFQFTSEGDPWPIVQEVNALLDAANDPWGVTCWWVDPHAGLAMPPADLIGGGRDDLLRQAAARVGEEY